MKSVPTLVVVLMMTLMDIPCSIASSTSKAATVVKRVVGIHVSRQLALSIDPDTKVVEQGFEQAEQHAVAEEPDIAYLENKKGTRLLRGRRT